MKRGHPCAGGEVNRPGDGLLPRRFFRYDEAFAMPLPARTGQAMVPGSGGFRDGGRHFLFSTEIVDGDT